jgi:ABC-type multidrug transport system permease subunit
MTLLLQLTTGLGDILGSSIAQPTGPQILDGALKVLFVVGFGVYTIFAFVVTRQISNMRRTLSTTASAPIRFVGYVHLLAAIGLFLLALLVL